MVGGEEVSGKSRAQHRRTNKRLKRLPSGIRGANPAQNSADIADSIPHSLLPNEGPRLGPPTNPDFSQLMDIIDTLDDMMDKKGWEYFVTAIPVDFSSIAYASQLRAQRAIDQIGGPETPEKERMILLWLDAFVAGYIMGHQKTLAEFGQDPEGNRRAPYVAAESDQQL